MAITSTHVAFNRAFKLVHGKLVSLKSFPKDQEVKAFRLTHQDGRVGHAVTNALQQSTVDASQFMGSAIWQVKNV